VSGDIVWQNIVSLYRTIQDGHDRREARWREHWAGRLDGASLTEVMRLRAAAELPVACHLRIGPDAWQRMRERWFREYRTDPLGGRLNSVLSTIDSVDVFTDVDMGECWQLWTGRIMGQGELIAQGTQA